MLLFAYPNCGPPLSPAHLSRPVSQWRAGVSIWQLPHPSHRVTGHTPSRGCAAGGLGFTACHLGELLNPSSGPQISASLVHEVRCTWYEHLRNVSHFPPPSSPGGATSHGTERAHLSNPSRWALPFPGAPASRLHDAGSLLLSSLARPWLPLRKSEGPSSPCALPSPT